MNYHYFPGLIAPDFLLLLYLTAFHFYINIIRFVIAVITKINLTAFDIPDAVFIARDPVKVKVDFAVLNPPPTVLVLGHSGVIKIYLAAADVPPSVFILLHAVAVKVYLAFDNSPPAIFVLGDSGISAVSYTHLDVYKRQGKFH